MYKIIAPLKDSSFESQTIFQLISRFNNTLRLTVESGLGISLSFFENRPGVSSAIYNGVINALQTNAFIAIEHYFLENPDNSDQIIWHIDASVMPKTELGQKEDRIRLLINPFNNGQNNTFCDYAKFHIDDYNGRKILVFSVRSLVVRNKLYPNARENDFNHLWYNKNLQSILEDNESRRHLLSAVESFCYYLRADERVRNILKAASIVF